MFRNILPASLLVLLLSVLPTRAGDETMPVRLADDFSTNTLKNYQVKGDVTWKKGQLTLAPNAKLTRKIGLGHKASLQALVRLPEAPAAGEIRLSLLSGGKGTDKIALRASGGKTTLTNLLGPEVVGPLDPHKPEKEPPAAPVWVVRLEVQYGLVMAKAWPQGQVEPSQWQSARYTDALLLEPDTVELKAGAEAGGFLLGFVASGSAPAKPLTTEQQQKSNRARALHQEVVALRRRGEADAALTKAKQLVELVKEIHDPQNPAVAFSLVELGQVLHDLGQLAAARPYVEEALAIQRKTLPPLHPELAMSLQALAQLLWNQGQTAAARSYVEEALVINRKALPPLHPDLARNLNRLGIVLQDLGQHDAARPYVEEALAIQRKVLPPFHPSLAAILMNLGRLHGNQGQLAAARSCFEEALTIHRKAFPPKHPALAESLLHVGLVLQNLGQPAAARPYLEEAVDIERKTLPTLHPMRSASLAGLAMVLRDLGQPGAARPYLEEAVDIERKTLPTLHPDLAKSLGRLGLILQDLGEHRDAWKQLAEAARSNGQYLAATVALTAQREHPGLAEQTHEYLDALVSLAEQTERLNPAQAGDLLASLLDWQALSSTTLSVRQEALAVSGDRAAAERLQQLQAVRQQLANLLLQGQGRLTPDAYRNSCTDLSRQEGQLERQLAEQVKDYSRLQQARRADPPRLAAQLKGGEVLVQLVRYGYRDFKVKNRRELWQPARYAALLLWRPDADQVKTEVRFVPLGDARAIDQSIHAWSNAAQQLEPIADRLDNELRQRVWEPLARALPAQTRRLFLVPDGELALLPFEALRLADGRFLIEQFAVSYLSNGRDLMPRPWPHDPPGPALVLADPDYNALDTQPRPPVRPPAGTTVAALGPPTRDLDGASGPAKSLPGFPREAEAVTRLLRGQPGWQVTLLERAAASEEALQKVPRPRLLYCITHGFFLRDRERLPMTEAEQRGLKLVDIGRPRWRPPDPGNDARLRSGLVLAGANRWQERMARGQSDGWLTAYEVENLDLWGTELVVLSACDTGRGAVQVGEGVLGLRRAFQLAGAKTVLASLWKVPDSETEQLMTRFFRHWLSGQGKAEALRAAQLDMIKELRASKHQQRRQAPPLYWAAFICHGQAR